MGTKKLCLLGASLDNHNLGINALAYGAIRCVQSAWPDAEISIVDFRRESIVYTVTAPSGETVPVRLWNVRLSKRFWAANHIVILLLLAAVSRLSPRRWRTAMINSNPTLRHLESCNLVGAISGGDSFSDLYGLARLIYVILPQLVVILLQRRLIVMPQTIGPFRVAAAKWIAASVLRRAEVVYARDHASEAVAMRLMRDAGNRVRFSYDLAFALQPQKPNDLRLQGFALSEPGAAEPLIGLNVSGLLCIGGYTGDNMFGLRGSYIELVHELIDHLVGRCGARLLLIPHVYGGNLKQESDEMHGRELYKKFAQVFPGRIAFLEPPYSASTVKHVIGACDLFIGSRMHACIAALSQQVPTVAIAYSGKFSEVLGSIGVDQGVCDARSLEHPEILHRIDEVWTHRHEIKQHLRDVIPQIERAVLGLFRRGLADQNPVEALQMEMNLS